MSDRDPVVRVLDLEATGLGDDALICEIGWCDVEAFTGRLARPASTLCRVPAMPPETRAIHHIRAEDTRDFPPYDRRSFYEQSVRDGIVGFAAHNAEFEGRFICGDLPLVCTYKASMMVWPEAPAHSVFGLLYWLEDLGKITIDPDLLGPAHRAGADAYATALLLAAIYHMGYDGRDLIKWTTAPANLPRCPIGDQRGQPWAEIDTGFLEWILRKPDMREDVAHCARQELDRRYPDG